MADPAYKRPLTFSAGNRTMESGRAVNALTFGSPVGSIPTPPTDAAGARLVWAPSF